MSKRMMFPRIYELVHPRSGRYWLVDTRSKKYGMTGRRHFNSEKAARDYAKPPSHSPAMLL